MMSTDMIRCNVDLSEFPEEGIRDNGSGGGRRDRVRSYRWGNEHDDGVVAAGNDVWHHSYGDQSCNDFRTAANNHNGGDNM